MRQGGWLLVAALAGSLGCHRSTPPKPVVPGPSLDGSSTAASGDAQARFVAAHGVGPTPEAACEQARTALAEALLTDARWLDVVPVDVHDPSRDIRKVTELGPGEHRCELGLEQGRAAAILSELELTPPRVEGPEPWRDVLYAFLYAHLAEHVCHRREALFAVPCEPTDTAEADAALLGLARGVSLAPARLGGVPVDADGRSLREPQVLVMTHGVPVSGVPLHVTRPADELPQSIRSDAGGRAIVGARGEVFEGPVRIELDVQALLGPLAEAWPASSLELAARPLDAGRWAVVVAGVADGASVGEQLDRALQRRGLAPAFSLEAKTADALLSAKPRQRASLLPSLADAGAGRLDILVFVDVRTRFAGRATGRRLWYEAIAAVSVHEAWTGRRLLGFEVSAKDSGVSDERAAQAAIGALVDRLAERIVSASELPVPEGVAAPRTSWSYPAARGSGSSVASDSSTRSSAVESSWVRTRSRNSPG